ncbi:MAG: hypothetical protein KC619_19890 [Myxococcales bacterium]|nr:hypothetical protein [Myxococcales bacterium]
MTKTPNEGPNEGALEDPASLSTKAAASAAWEQRAERELQAQLEARARVPDFRGMAPFAKSRFAKGLSPLGFAHALDEASTGRVRRDIMRAERVVVRVVEVEGGLVVDGVRVEASPYRVARADRRGDELQLRGDWALATDFEVDQIRNALAALGANPVALGRDPVDAWTLGLSYAQGNEKTVRCLMCRHKVEDFVRLSAAYARGPAPDGSARRDWEEQRIFVGLVHLACAAEHRPADLAAVIAEREAVGGDVSAFAAFRGVGAALVQGKLERCDRCRRPIKKDEWRLQIGDGASHVECGREHQPEALARALARAPDGYPGA